MEKTLNRESLVSSIQSYSEGHGRQLELIVHQCHHAKCKDVFISEVLLALRQSVGFMRKEKFEPVVNSLLKFCGWTRRSQSVICNYQSLMTNLVSAHTSYLNSVLASILVHMSLSDQEWGQDCNQNGTRMELYSQCVPHVHHLLQAILKTVPMVPKMLPREISAHFPYVYHTETIKVHRYAQNLLQLASYCPAVQADIFALLIEKMTLLDAKAPRRLLTSLVQDSEFDSDDEDQEIFKIEEESGLPNMPSEAQTLDNLLALFYSHINKSCRLPDGSLDWEKTKALYMTLLSIFDKIILPTHECCHVQFILFYIISFKLPLVEGFIDYLWKKVKDPSNHRIKRQYAVCYLASLIARHRHVSIRTAADCLSVMCDWIHKYIRESSDSPNQMDILHHGAFYSTCQAVFYSLAFRQHEFMQLPQASAFFTSLGLQNITHCRLNPLRVCLPVITRTFSAFVRKHQLAMCDNVIERNSRQAILVTQASSGSTDAQATSPVLHSYFPFDPYLLEKSGAALHPIYREFEGSVITEMSKHAEDSEDEDMPEEEMCSKTLESVTEQYLAQSMSPGERLIQQAMSVSPGFSTLNQFKLE